jgi:S-(hydroxymethyl)glutathione dehydrogenase / alcohol dehydrogenase
MTVSGDADTRVAGSFEGRTMRAAVFRQVGRPIEIEEVEVAEPARGEVLVRIAASGICHSDYHVVLGEWSAPVPLILGHEGAGVVEAVGEGVESLQAGDHVVLSWCPSCRHCEFCVSGRPQLCSVAAATTYESVMFDGTTRLRQGDDPVHAFTAVGSFGEYAVVPESGAVRISPRVPLDQAALVGCAVATGVGAVVNTARVPPGASVAVLGCGGVGMAILQGAALVSASPVIAVDVTERKLELARSLGATHSVNASTQDVVQAVSEITAGVGLDFAFEAIGLAATIEKAAAMLAPGGTAVLVGQAPEGVTVTLDPLLISDREHRIIGCNYGSCRPAIDFPRILSLSMSGSIDLEAMITRRMRLEDLGDAFEAMGRGDVVRSLIVHDN